MVESRRFPEGEVSYSPLVSVVIPTYRRPEYLTTCLRSVVSQTYGNLEIIVNDNASEDDIRSVVDRFQDPRIRFFRNDETIGQTRNFSTALSRATGDYIALVGDDDILEPSFVEKLVAPMVDPDVVVSFCGMWILHGDGRLDQVQTDKATRFFGMHVITPGKHTNSEVLALHWRSISIVSGCLLRRSAADWADLPDMTTFADLYMMYVIVRTGKACYYVPERLTSFRWHSDQILKKKDPAAKVAAQQSALDCWNMIGQDAALQHRGYYKIQYARVLGFLLYYMIKNGQVREAFVKLWKSIRYRKLSPDVLLQLLIYTRNFRAAGLQRKLP